MLPAQMPRCSHKSYKFLWPVRFGLCSPAWSLQVHFHCGVHTQPYANLYVKGIGVGWTGLDYVKIVYAATP